MIAALRLPGPLLERASAGRVASRIRGARIDAQVAAMLAYDDVLHESDLRGLAPGPARRSVETSAIAVTLPRRHDVATRELVLEGRRVRVAVSRVRTEGDARRLGSHPSTSTAAAG